MESAGRSESSDASPAPPTPDAIADRFQVYEVRREDGQIYYFGLPLVEADRLEAAVLEQFHDAGYEVKYVTQAGEDVLVARPQQRTDDGPPWTHITLFGLTVLSTLFAGALWFHVDLTDNPAAILQGWPFAAAILTVLGVHELGHYALGRYHGVNVTLPYFIPVPTLIGTMGAVIRMKGRIPNRRALFDIGVAGPLAGLIATIVVSSIGLSLGPIRVPEWVVQAEDAIRITVGYPPLMEFLAWALDAQLRYDDPRLTVHPVVIGGWVGMFVTFLNMIPVGQLDGGHVLHAIADSLYRPISLAVPGTLIALALGLHVVGGVPLNDVAVWLFWGVLTGILAVVGSVRPVSEETIGPGRRALGVLTFLLAGLCFAPVPLSMS